MSTKKAVLTIPYQVYTMEEVERLMTASKALDLTGEELIRKALNQYLSIFNL